MLSTFQARCMLVSSLFIPNVLPVFNLGWVNLNTNQNYILLSVCTLKSVILIKYCTEHTQCKIRTTQFSCARMQQTARCCLISHKNLDGAYCIDGEARPLSRFCKVAFLSQVVRRLEAKKERSQQHKLIGYESLYLAFYVWKEFTV